MQDSQRGREADRPRELGRRGWLDVVWRVRREVKNDHLPLLAGGCQSVLGPTPVEGEWQAYTSAHFSLHVRPGTFAERSISTITGWLEDQYAFTNARLELAYAGRVTGLLYPSADDAGRTSDRSGTGYPETESFKAVCVAPLDVQQARNLYVVRGALDGAAARLAATNYTPHLAQRGRNLLEVGRRAVASGYVPSVIEADIDFHLFVYEASGNPLIGETAQPHWQHLRRVMAAALGESDLRVSVWDEHEGILRALEAGCARGVGPRGLQPYDGWAVGGEGRMSAKLNLLIYRSCPAIPNLCLAADRSARQAGGGGEPARHWRSAWGRRRSRSRRPPARRTAPDPPRCASTHTAQKWCRT